MKYDPELERDMNAVEQYCKTAAQDCLREAGGKLAHPFLVPGAHYAQELWDWDSWLSSIPVADLVQKDVTPYERGCVLNFLDAEDKDGRIPVVISNQTDRFDLKPGVLTNVHKPCLAAMAYNVTMREGGDASWLKDGFPKLEAYLAYYQKNLYHEESGLYVFYDDFAIGVDNDPCTFYRPHKSTGSIFLNSLMIHELDSMAKLCGLLGKKDREDYYNGLKDHLIQSVQRECYDERNGFYYSADVNLRPVDPHEWLHCGAPRNYASLPMRIDVWTGILPLWLKIATPEQAKRVLEENALNPATLYCPYGIRSLSKLEKMYRLRTGGNPSPWTGNIWINANYFLYLAEKNYGYAKEAKELAIATIKMLGEDILQNGAMHEFYHPDTGAGCYNLGFQSWNMLAYYMVQDLKKE